MTDTRTTGSTETTDTDSQPGVVQAVTEAPKELANEAAAGRSPRTPAIAITGVTLVVGAIVAVILVAALLVYYLA
jgi:beta-lactamase regulating signal transducer with metallopeptidase domain